MQDTPGSCWVSDEGSDEGAICMPSMPYEGVICMCRIAEQAAYTG